MHTEKFFQESVSICQTLDYRKIEELAVILRGVRDRGGRVFVLGIGGSAGNASHMVNDLRKLCSIEAYAPTDNVSELTARTNDEGFDTIFSEWLEISNINASDALFILSVGGGSKERGISTAIIKAIDLGLYQGTDVLGIVGNPNGYTAVKGDCVVVIPSPNPDHVTPQSEAFQALVWHSLVSNPVLQTKRTTW